MVENVLPPIALIGLMGAGKSTVARILGERLAGSVADLDSMIEAEEGRRIPALFAGEGEAWFRRREAELLERVLAGPARVLACGGGIVLDGGSRDRLRRSCRVVWLQASPELAAERLVNETHERPLLGSGPRRERLSELLETRSELYEATAHVRVDTVGRDPEAVAGAVLAALADWRAEPAAEPRG
ncbi:MAG: shikimate kinase [Candidatus Eisenbacteria bacterium]